MGQPETGPPAVGVRLAWAELPARVRALVEDALGAPVVQASSQPGGFSPGVAARVVLADGRRGFVKAVGVELNPDSPRIHRAEAAVTAALRGTAHSPRLLEVVDTGDWVALVFQDVAGRQPTLP